MAPKFQDPFAGWGATVVDFLWVSAYLIGMRLRTTHDSKIYMGKK